MGLISDHRARRRETSELIRDLVASALQVSEARVDAIVDRAIEVAKIAAPTGDEGRRSAAVSAMFLSRGISDVAVDDLGNVVARVRGAGDGSPLLLAAHLDTVFSLASELEMSRSAERVSGPGIGDNSLGIACALSVPEVLAALGIQPAVDLLITGNVGEEGLGDLRGIRRVMDDRPEIGAVIAIEGHNFGRVTHVAVGSRRLQVRVTGEGGHSWGDFGNSNAIQGAAEIIHELGKIPLPANPKTTLNVGIIHGGTSINTIAPEAAFNLDLRSVEAFALRRLIERVERVLTLPRRGLTVEFEIVGDRPAGIVPAESRLVRIAVDILDELGVAPAGDASSTDANIPISRGVPAICIGLTTGGGVHREDEFIDIPPIAQGFAQLIALTVIAADDLQRGALKL